MNMIVKTSDDDVILIPNQLMKALNLQDGDQVAAVVEGKTLKLTPVEQFLALRGVFQNEEAFEQAIEELNKAWESWTPTPSV